MTTADKGITSRFLSALTGAVRRTLQSKAADSVNIKDFGAVCDGTTDDTAAWVAAIAACSSDTQSQSKTIRFNGSSKITSPLTISRQYVQIEGESPYASKILFNGVAGGCIKLGGQQYLRAVMRNFGIEGDAGSGIGLDLSGITSQVYSSVFENLFIKSGGTAFYAPGGATSPEFFNNVVRLVHAYSYNGHAFHVANGPGVTYESCYAVEVPAGKAGYRMAGVINLISCNGLNEGDVWGAFGSETAGSDGFQGDFGYTDYPVLNMVGCNVERFGSRTTNGIGIRICNNYRTVNIIGGSIQRADSDIPLGANSYKAILSCRYGSNQTGNSIKFGPGALYLRDVVDGTGTNTPSQAHFYFEFGGHLEDTSLIAEAANITSYRVNADALSYPTTRNKLINDIYGGYAQEARALSPRRLSLQTTRYATGAVITPVGTNQAIDVTGRSKVIVTPAAAASISTATFTTTPSDPVGDYGRNGELVIEAGNANLTIVHSASGANTFKTVDGVDVIMSAGQLLRFLRSDVNSNWVQVSAPAVAGSTQFTMDTIFHNPYLDLWTANGKVAGPPDGFTTTGLANSANPTAGAYPGNPVGSATSVRFSQGGTTYADSLMIVPSAQPWNANDSVSFMIAICVEVAQYGARVFFDNGSTQTVVGHVTNTGTWQVIRGTGTLIAGNNWKIAIAAYDTTYRLGQLFVGGVNIVRGTTLPAQIADSFGRRGWVASSITYPPPFVGCRAYISGTGKWYMAANTTAPTDWILLN